MLNEKECCYRPPDAFRDFQNAFKDRLRSAFRSYKREVSVLVDAVFTEALSAVIGLFEAKKMM